MKDSFEHGHGPRTDAAGDNRMRLLGFERVDLQPGESRRVTLTTDPWFVARYDGSLVGGGPLKRGKVGALTAW
jgi:hypothetical protein